ncbi:hypothetical protein Tco_0575740 [Tanacetum coccineum]
MEDEDLKIARRDVAKNEKKIRAAEEAADLQRRRQRVPVLPAHNENVIESAQARASLIKAKEKVEAAKFMIIMDSLFVMLFEASCGLTQYEPVKTEQACAQLKHPYLNVWKSFHGPRIVRIETSCLTELLGEQPTLVGSKLA